MRCCEGLGHIDWDRVQIDIWVERIAAVGQCSMIRVAQHCVDVINLAKTLKKRNQIQ